MPSSWAAPLTGGGPGSVTECGTTCESCFSQDFCIQCKRRFYLYKGKCLPTCPLGTAARQSPRECQGEWGPPHPARSPCALQQRPVRVSGDLETMSHGWQAQHTGQAYTGANQYAKTTNYDDDYCYQRQHRYYVQGRQLSTEEHSFLNKTHPGSNPNSKVYPFVTLSKLFKLSVPQYL